MEVEIMPEGFSPRRRGRKPTYDLSEVLQGLTDYPGRWLRYTLTITEAQSAKRQLDRMGMDNTVDKLDDSTAALYVRSK